MNGALPDGWSFIEPPSDGPGGVLQRAAGPDGKLGIVVQFRPDMRSHPVLGEHLEPLVPFLKDPGVPGVLPLLYWDPERASYLYEIGDGRVLAEIIRECVQRGVFLGERVAVELFAAVITLLKPASEAGSAPWIAQPSGSESFAHRGVPERHAGAVGLRTGPGGGPRLARGRHR